MNKGVHNLINGVAADYLNVNDRAIHYGDGLFETILLGGKQLYYWQQHYQRLLDSSVSLKLNCPAQQVLLNDIKQLIKTVEYSAQHVYAIKIILTRGAGERGYQFTSAKRNAEAIHNRIVSISPLAKDYSALITGVLSSGELYLCKQQVSINQGLAGIKHLNRLENVLARNEWGATGESGKAKNIIDGIMLNAHQHVIEGCMSNLFAVKGKQLLTPDLSLSGVNGVMRNMIIDSAKKNGILVSITDLGMDDLLSMDEIFISNSLIGMKSVNQIQRSVYKEKNVTKLLFEDLLATKNNYAETV